MFPHSRVEKKNTKKKRNEEPPSVTTHIQRSYHQQGSVYHDPAGNDTTQESRDNRNQMQLK